MPALAEGVGSSLACAACAGSGKALTEHRRLLPAAGSPSLRGREALRRRLAGSVVAPQCLPEPPARWCGGCFLISRGLGSSRVCYHLSDCIAVLQLQIVKVSFSSKVLTANIPKFSACLLHQASQRKKPA